MSEEAKWGYFFAASLTLCIPAIGYYLLEKAINRKGLTKKKDSQLEREVIEQKN